jgi:hypothetical protein
MTFQTYVPLAVRTESAKNPFSKEFEASSGMNVRMFHAILGMETEVNEMLDATDNVNMLEECGDFSWYQAIYEAACPGTIDESFILPAVSDKTILVDVLCQTFNNMLEHSKDVNDKNILVDLLRQTVNNILDHSKKVLMYGKPFDIEAVAINMNKSYYLVNQLITVCGGTPEQVREVNIAKLSARYPDKFNDYHAENRDLEKERAILEAGV